METPKTKAGMLTEKIMLIFWSSIRPPELPKLETAAYNRVYEHVLSVLTEAEKSGLFKD
jgi:hypothetical protein